MDVTEPLLGARTEQRKDDASILSGSDIVDFDPAGDDDNPNDWAPAFKWSVVALLAAMAFTVTFTCISVVPVASRIARELDDGNRSKSASVLLVTIWELGEAAGPLLIAPLSEMFGRYPVINAANGLFVAATVLAAVSDSTTVFIAARALTGLAVASNVLNPAIVGDIFAPEQRGTAMSLIMVAPLLGGAIGPAIAGAVAQTLGWRYIVWMSAVLAGACEILFLFCFRETYKVPILRRRAARLREQTGDITLKTKFDVDSEKGSSKLWASVMRPASVLFGSGVLVGISLCGSVVYTYFYIMSVTLPDILEDIYGLSPAQAGSAFMSFSSGSLVGIVICNLALDRIYVHLRDLNKGIGQPEYRLPLAVIGGFSLPLSILAYGWITQLKLPLILLLASVGLMGFTFTLAFMPLMAYVVDATGLYSASAMTGLIVTRCLMGTFLPLTTAPLVGNLGYGWGFTILAAICLCTAPIPSLLMRYGQQWRGRSKYTREA